MSIIRLDEAMLSHRDCESSPSTQYQPPLRFTKGVEL